jgi:catechol 2,3-dioxygenase
MVTQTKTAAAEQAASAPIDPGVRIGHVHLKVADLDRALAFYCGVLGFQLMQRIGAQAAFISAGGYHHHIGLNTWESRGGSPPPPGTTGLYHLAVLYPTRAALADALRRLIEAAIPLDGASDHGVSEALYLRNPDENGVELYWNRPREEWPRAADGNLSMFTQRLDLMGLLRRKDRRGEPDEWSENGRLRFGRTRGSRRLARRRRMDGERMHPAGKLARQRHVDHAVAFEPVLPAKGLGHDIHAEVRLAARPMASVTFVPVGFVFNAQVLGRESLAQLFSDEILGSHRAALARPKQRGQRRRRAVLPPVKS